MPTKNARVGVGRGEQLGAEPQRAAAAGRLDADDAIVAGDGAPSTIGRISSVKRASPRDAEIALGLLRLPQDAVRPP